MSARDAAGRLPPESPLLARMWDETDWDRAEARLAALQRAISAASAAFDKEAVRALQDELVRDLDCRRLAVRRVTRSSSGPGVDGVRWASASQKMAAAVSLGPDGYRASAQRLVKVRPRHGKERTVKLSTFFDRAMATLYAFALAPVTEASADERSFAFRKGRSARDALACAVEMFDGRDAPRYALAVDVRAYYDNIAHAWLLSHVPMDHDVLREFLGAGVVYAHALFPAGDRGISLGNPLSPVLGNFVLDGMQRAVDAALADAGRAGGRNGRLVRFADDVLVALRGAGDVEVAKSAIEAFCAERGLALNEDKTVVCTTRQPLDFLGYTLQRRGDAMTCRPSDASVARLSAELKGEIAGWRKSLRALIEHLNKRLKGWAGYFRYGDSRPAFRAVDCAVDAALLEALVERHPARQVRDLADEYWRKPPGGGRQFTHPADRTLRVCRIADAPTAGRRGLRTAANPFIDAAYFDRRREERDIANVAGPWRAAWDRQRGRCHFCGAPILPDQPRLVTARGGEPSVTPRNAAYIHEACAFDEVELVMLDTSAPVTRYDVPAALERLDALARGEADPFPTNWKYAPLRDYFLHQDAARITLTFDEMEEIIGGPLPVHALRDRTWWKLKPGKIHPPRSWSDAGYDLADVNVKARKASFKRATGDGLPLTLPPQLQNRRVPDDVAYEFDQFCQDLIHRYNL